MKLRPQTIVSVNISGNWRSSVESHTPLIRIPNSRGTVVGGTQPDTPGKPQNSPSLREKKALKLSRLLEWDERWANSTSQVRPPLWSYTPCLKAAAGREGRKWGERGDSRPLEACRPPGPCWWRENLPQTKTEELLSCWTDGFLFKVPKLFLKVNAVNA